MGAFSGIVELGKSAREEHDAFDALLDALFNRCPGNLAGGHHDCQVYLIGNIKDAGMAFQIEDGGRSRVYRVDIAPIPVGFHDGEVGVTETGGVA